MLGGMTQNVAGPQRAAHVAEHTVTEDPAARPDLLLERGEFGVRQVLPAVLLGQVDAVEAECTAALPDGFEVGSGQTVAGVMPRSRS